MEGPKKRKLEQIDHFTPMNDDCIFEILSWLNLDDLCVLSRTCKKLRDIAVREFQRKYSQGKVLCILEKELPLPLEAPTYYRTTVSVSPNESYVKCFGRYIRNVFVSFSDRKLNLDLAAFMQTHINQLTKKIEFSRGNCYINESFAEGIKSILENVECVVFSVCHGNENNFYDEILKRCKQLKHLEINLNVRLNCAQLPLHEHPHLQSFKCSIPDKRMIENLDKFLKLNSTVKQIACSFGNDLPFVDIVNCFKVVAENSKNLEDVSFRMEQSSKNLTLIENELKLLSNSDQIKRYELVLTDPYGYSEENVAAFMFLTGFICDGRCLPLIIQSQSPFTKLKILIFKNGIHVNKQIATHLSNMLLPNLEVLSFEKAQIEEEKFSDVLIPFVRHSQQLRKIYFSGYYLEKIQCSAKEIKILNHERGKLEGACKLTVYLDSYFNKKLLERLSKILANNEKNLVHLAPSSREPELEVIV